jgi:hypothetical protein
VRVLGETGPCFDTDGGYAEDRLTLVSNSGKVLYAALM